MVGIYNSGFMSIATDLSISPSLYFAFHISQAGKTSAIRPDTARSDVLQVGKLPVIHVTQLRIEGVECQCCDVARGNHASFICCC